MQEDKRGKHPNSRSNLIPFEKGDTRINRDGRKQGSRNRKAILEEMMTTVLNKDNIALAKLSQDFPELLEKESVTIQELLFARLIREAILSSKPISYIKEILDRIEGKPQQQKDSQQASGDFVDNEERMLILEEKIKEAQEEQQNTEDDK